MKAVVLTDARTLELADLPDPDPRPGEVLVRPHFCGICGTDLHAAEIDLFREGVVLGHEFAGEVVAVGREVAGWEVGQLVTANPNGHTCGACEACRAGRLNLCQVATVERPLGVAVPGGMAELVALHPSYLHALPDGLTTRTAAWTEPLAVAVRAVRTSPLKVGDTAAVIGGGPVGQLVVQVLRRAGAARVLLVEPSAFRRETALRTGADEAVTPDEMAARLAAGEQRPVDHVFECSGFHAAVQSALELVAPGGSIRLVGMSPRPPSFDAVQAIMKEVTILGGFIYVTEFPQAVGLLAAGAVDVAPLTSGTRPLSQFAEAFADLRQPETAMKVLIDAQAEATA